MRVTPLLALTLVACAEPPATRAPAPGEKAARADTLRAGQVVDAVTGEPVPGARVWVEGTLRQALVDADGRFEVLAPGGFGRLGAEAPGYLTGSTPGTTLALWPAETSEADAHQVLDRRELGRMARDADDLDDPDLRPFARDLIVARRQAPALTDAQLFPRRPVLKGALELPATVRVYRRGAENDSCRGRVDVIPLEEYVRGVVPHEWIPSWHIESLKAGAVAARTYAANWVTNGGKYDCADVDDTARSQVYADDRNARADEAVRATACEVVVRDGSMINAEYSAENSDPTEFGVSEPLCSGRARNGHGRGMCQWGTQRWADQRGQTYRWMVEHYYPGGGVGNGCADPRPDLQLRQRLARVDAEPCIDPEGSYDCADFVRQGWSVDIFDLYAGRRFELAIELTNSGGAATPDGTLLKLALPASLAATGVEVGGRAAGVALGGAGATVEVPVPAIQPGAMARVAFTLRGEGSSLPVGAPVPVRTWVARMGAFYDKPDWGGAARANDGQTFNGGDLKVLAEFDVFSRDDWTFDAADPTLVEGWEGVDRGALRAPGGALQVPVGGAVSPFTHIDADRLTRVEAVGLAGRLYWRRAGEGFDGQRSVRVDGEADLAGLPGWSGEIQQVRFEPDAAGGLDRLAFRPAAGPGPEPDAAPPPPPRDASVETDPPPPRPRRDAGEEPHDPLPDLEDAGTGATPVPPLPPGARGVRGETTSGCQAGGAAPGGALFGLLLVALPLLRRRRRP